MNKRANEMWDIISQHVDFEDKSVLDFGCGPGDFVVRASNSGAKSVLGIDRSLAACLDAQQYATEELKSPEQRKHVTFKSLDIHNIVYRMKMYDDLFYFDIIMCFSVLPYLHAVRETLQWIRGHSETALIECQYRDDGPGLVWIKDDNDMRHLLLETGWENISPIGETATRIRPVTRTIWKCED